MADLPLQPGEIKLAGDGYIVVADGLAGSDLGEYGLRRYGRAVGQIGINSGFICSCTLHDQSEQEQGQEKAAQAGAFCHRFAFNLSQDLSLCYCRISES